MAWHHGSKICFATFGENHKIANNSAATEAREKKHRFGIHGILGNFWLNLEQDQI